MEDVPKRPFPMAAPRALFPDAKDANARTVCARRIRIVATMRGTTSASACVPKTAVDAVELQVKAPAQGQQGVNPSTDRDATGVSAKPVYAASTPSAAIPNGMQHAHKSARTIAEGVQISPKTRVVQPKGMDAAAWMVQVAEDAGVKHAYANRTPTAARRSGMISARKAAKTTVGSVGTVVALVPSMVAPLRRVQDVGDAIVKPAYVDSTRIAAITRGTMSA